MPTPRGPWKRRRRGPDRDPELEEDTVHPSHLSVDTIGRIHTIASKSSAIRSLLPQDELALRNPNMHAFQQVQTNRIDDGAVTFGKFEGFAASKISAAHAMAGSAASSGGEPYFSTVSLTSLKVKTKNVSSDANVVLNDATVYTVDTSGGTVTLTLPAAALCSGLVLSFKKTASGNNMVIDGNSSETIDGATTKTYGTQWTGTTIVSTGSQWVSI